MPKKNRPLSPHLTIYKPQITSMLSILHRITGVGLCFGALLFIWFLFSFMMGPEAYQAYQACMDIFVMQLLLAGFMLALVYHFFNGIRHLIWDMGKGFEIECVNSSGWITLVLTVGVSAFLIWKILC